MPEFRVKMRLNKVFFMQLVCMFRSRSRHARHFVTWLSRTDGFLRLHAARVAPGNEFDGCFVTFFPMFATDLRACEE